MRFDYDTGHRRRARHGHGMSIEGLRDKMATRLFGRTWAEAQEKGECISCGRLVNPVDLTPDNRAEYDMSALCPQCYDALIPEDEDDMVLCACAHPYGDHEGEDGLCVFGCDLRGCDAP